MNVRLHDIHINFGEPINNRRNVYRHIPGMRSSPRDWRSRHFMDTVRIWVWKFWVYALSLWRSIDRLCFYSLISGHLFIQLFAGQLHDKYSQTNGNYNLKNEVHKQYHKTLRLDGCKPWITLFTKINSCNKQKWKPIYYSGKVIFEFDLTSYKHVRISRLHELSEKWVGSFIMSWMESVHYFITLSVAQKSAKPIAVKITTNAQ